MVDRASSLEPHLVDFVRESNLIERIDRDPTEREIQAHYDLLLAGELTTRVVRRFVENVAPNARLRDRPGLNVAVGDHVAPRGGPDIAEQLDRILRAVNAGDRLHPVDLYHQYLWLHPFTDGNGRSGRAIWLWHLFNGEDQTTWPIGETLQRGFLKTFHYQTLDLLDREIAQRRRTPLAGWGDQTLYALERAARRARDQAEAHGRSEQENGVVSLQGEAWRSDAEMLEELVETMRGDVSRG